MTAVWQDMTLGDLEHAAGGVIQTGPFGSQLHTSDYSSCGTPVVMPTNIRDLRIDATDIARVGSQHVDRLSRHVLQPGDIIYSRRGDVEKCALVTPDESGWLCGTGCLLVRIKGINPRYLAYALSLPATRAWIARHAIGATMPNLNTNILREVPITIPDRGTQDAIATTLGAIDDKIDSNRQVGKKCLTLARAWVHKETEGTNLEPLDNVALVRMGAAFSGASFAAPGTGRPLLRIRDLKTGSPQVWTTETRSDEAVILPGDIVVGMDAEFHATLWMGAPSVLNQRVCSFAGCQGVSRAFILAALEPPLAWYEQAKTGTTVIHLNKADIDRFMVPRLTIAKHEALAAITEPLIDRAVTCAKEAQVLAALRDTLLPELLSGRIRADISVR